MICSQSSRAVGEPIAGTAVAHTWRWLGVEYRQRWEARAVDAADLGPARAWVDAFAAREGTRVQLVCQARDDRPPAVFFADTRERRVHRFTLSDLPDLDAVLDGSAGGRTDETVVWVCTNGRRDACCARFGVRAYQGLVDRMGDAVWQTTHLGGHRFAATLVVLPEGLCYGRLRTRHLDGLVAAIDAGRVYDLEHLRGRVAWSRAAQVAETTLRAQTGNRAPGAVELLGEDDAGDAVLVRMRLDGGEHRVRVERVQLPASLASCGKEPEVRTALRAAGAA